MRLLICGLVITLCLIAVALASPANEKKQAPACSTNCGEEYAPVCAKAKNGNKERLLSFGSACVLDKFNCQHPDDPYEMKSKGECGGNVSVRLS